MDKDLEVMLRENIKTLEAENQGLKQDVLSLQQEKIEISSSVDKLKEDNERLTRRVDIYEEFMPKSARPTDDTNGTGDTDSVSTEDIFDAAMKTQEQE